MISRQYITIPHVDILTEFESILFSYNSGPLKYWKSGKICSYLATSCFVSSRNSGGTKAESRSSSAIIALPLLTSFKMVWPHVFSSARKSISLEHATVEHKSKFCCHVIKNMETIQFRLWVIIYKALRWLNTNLIKVCPFSVDQQNCNANNDIIGRITWYTYLPPVPTIVTINKCCHRFISTAGLCL